MTVAIQPLIRAWNALQTLVPVFTIRDEQQYDKASSTLHWLLDVVKDDETHPLYDLVDILGTLIHAYEESHYPMPDATGIDVLKFLMDEHGLAPSDLPEIGDKAVVSDLIAGKRQLDVENIKSLSKRFGLSPATFI